MIIQLEGPDGAGKTTLAHGLAKAWRKAGGEAAIVHSGPPGTWNPTEMYLETWRRYCYNRLRAVLDTVEHVSGDCLLVMDRGAWGSPIYGGLYRPDVNLDGFGDLGREYFFRFEEDLYVRDGITALILPPVETLIERSRDREDPYLDSVEGERETQLKQIYSAYADFAQTEGKNLSTFAGVYDAPKPEELIKKVSLAGL
ncbi:thymidylate kinase [Gordonia phage Sixama]|uniref:Thymidylate kinase n=1 Tax=Gordonia phage Sixama TaxID=2653271 RepID=A0A5Q2F0N9_9CAUD|nr:thymidylate kinase [Gordonia phage Sixama]QGF20330.1 thymidylate kinase [Gordonia phage Sixama]